MCSLFRGGIKMVLSFALILTYLKNIIFLVAYVSNTNSFPQPLTAEEESNLLIQFKKGNDEARNTLIERNLRLVAHVAKKYSYLGKDIDDLISIGTIGLIKAVTTFDQGKGTRLATYAARCIENAISSLRKHSHIPIATRCLVKCEIF